MKLKMILALILSITAQTSMGSSQNELECRGKVFAVLGIHKHSTQGQVVYNYSSGDLVCPTTWTQILKTSGSVDCIAYWHWDFEKNGQSIANSMTWVRITNSGQKISATMRTNRTYGYRLEKMNCELK